MLKMINVTEILLYKFRDNWSSRKIKDKTNYSRTTILRYISSFYKFKDAYLSRNSSLPPIM